MIDDLLSYIQSTIIKYLTCINVEPATELAANPLKTTADDATGAANHPVWNFRAPEPETGKMERNGQPSIVLNVEQFIRDVEDRPAIWNRNYHCNKLFMEQTWDELSELHKLPKQTLKTKWKGLRDNFRVEYKRIPRNENGDFLIPPETHDSKWTHYHSLLFLTDHMRHRQPKSDNEQYYYNNYSHDGEEYEHTLVEPDLTNGLIQFHEQEDSNPAHGIRINGITVSMAPFTAPECSSNDSALYSNNGTSSTYAHSGSGSGSNSLVPSITIKRKRQSEDSEDIKPMLDLPPVDPDDDFHYLLSLHPYMKQLNASQKLRIRTKIQKLIFKELYKEDIEETR